MEANVRKNRIALSFLIAAIVLIMAFAIGTILYGQEAEAKVTDTLCKTHLYSSGVVITPATCTSSGTKGTVCDICGMTKAGSTYSYAALGHSYGSWSTTTAATCGKNGSKKRTCTRSGCSAYETQTISATGNHAYALDSYIMKQPTCTTSGQYGSQCANCASTKAGSSIPKLGHDYRYSTKNATCTADGSTTTTCSRCTYSSTTTIPKKGHAYAMDALIGANATCTTAGYYLNQCANCKGTTTGSSIPKLGHSYGNWYTSKAATCTATGTSRRDCSRCSSYETSTISATGHAVAMDNMVITYATCTASGQYGNKCANCSYYTAGSTYGPLGHTGGTATCTTGKKCTRCSSYYGSSLGHTGGTATCTVKATCTRCSTKYGDLAPHQVAMDNYIITYATCTTSGQYGNKCAKCSYYTAGSSYGPLGHTGGTATCTSYKTCTRCGVGYGSLAAHQIARDNIIIKEATCTASGQYGSKCANCSYYESGSSYGPLGHTGGTATCTTGKKCTRCSSYYGSSLGHTGGTATCTVKKTCTRCSTKYGDLAPHQIAMDNMIITYATCTASGQYGNKCANCSHYTAGSTYGPLGHSYGSWYTSKAATCTATGTSRRDCGRSGCSSYETSTISATGHQIAMDNIIIKEATCTSAGQYGNKCAKCAHYTAGSTYGPLGHNWSNWTVTSKGTCSNPGSQYRTCSRCSSQETEQIIIPHVIAYDNGIYKEATCTVAGQLAHICANCLYKEPGSVYGPLGHTGGTATCTKKATCSRCGTQYGTERPHVIALDNVWITEPTCTSAGQYGSKCANCLYTEPGSSAPPYGHNWSGYTVTDQGTCAKPGSKYRTCLRCSLKETEKITVPHQMALQNGYITAPTCTTAGQYGNFCANYAKCLYVEPSDVAPALGHSWGAWRINKRETCTADGEDIRTCQRSGCSASQTQVRRRTGHTLAMDWSIGKYATCYESGYYLNVCMNEPCRYTEIGSTYYRSHKMSGWTITDSGTCAKPGSKYRTCEWDDCSYKETESITVPHQVALQNGYIKAPTCTAPGQYGNFCANYDNCRYVEPSDTAPALGHTGGTATCTTLKRCTRVVNGSKCNAAYGEYAPHQMAMDNVILREPTSCTGYGQYGNKCANCTYTTEGTSYGPIGHVWGSTGTTTPGTCKSQAVTTYKCTRTWNGKQCTGEKKEYGEKDPNVHELLGLREEQATCTKPGAIYQYCSYCKKDAYKEKDLPALGHQWPYACTATCTRTVDGATCGAANPNRQDHNYAETISGRTHTFKCTWCGYSYYYVDAAGEYVLSGVWKWNAAETPDPNGTLGNEWHPFWIPDSLAKDGDSLIKGDHPNDVVILNHNNTHPFCKAEIVIPIANGFTAGGSTYYGLRIRPGIGETCCYYDMYQVIGLYYLSDLSYNGMWGGTLVGHQEQNIVGHTHEHNGWEWMQWQQRSLATLDFGEGTAVSATAYQFIQWNAYQLQSQYTIDIYRQKPNVSMSGNFNTDKANNKYEYYTTLTFTEPQSVNITPAYPTYQGFNLVYKSYDSITLGEGRQALIAYYNRLPAGVTLNLAGGSSSSSTSKTMYYGDTIAQQLGGSLPTPTRAGFKFLGWTRTEKQGSKDYVSNTSTITLGDVSYGSLTLYAQWECQHLTLSDLTVTTKGTCTTDGSGYRTCATPGCDYALRNNKLPKEKYTVTEVIPARGHSWATSLTHDTQAHWYNCTNEENALYTGCVNFTGKATHTYVTIIPATCTDSGVERCTFCGHENVIKHLGHNWSDTYWHNETGHWHKCTRCQVNCTTACTGTDSHACPTCGATSTGACGHTAHTHATAHTYKTTKAATCTKDGVETCTVCGHTRAISHLGHNWSSTYTTDASNHWHECTRCGVDCYTACVGDNEHECNTCGDTSYTSCGHYAHTHGKAHDWVITTPPNCTNKGTATCSVCGRTTQDVSQVPELDILGHLWSDWQYTCGEYWCDSASCKHYKICVRDNCPGNAGGKPAINDHASHTWVYASNSDRPTCTDDGVQTCSVCGHVRVIAHTGHTWSSQWQHDGYDHWHKCSTCGETCYYPCCDIHACTQHTAGDYHYAHKWTITTHPTCTTNGTRKCDICGRTETLDATGHDFSGNWDGSNVTGHWHICNNTNLNNGVKCTATDGPFAHDAYAAGEADACFKCADCGYITDSVHNYEYPCDAYCDDCGCSRDDAAHNSITASSPDAWTCMICSYCGVTTEDYHTYSYECDSTCNVCGYVREASHHRVHLATEDSTACTQCEYCGIVVDSTHSFSGPCDSTCDIIDDNGNDCPYTRQITHEWEIISSTGATCLTPGFVEKKCKLCGTELSIQDEIDPDNHEGEFVQTGAYDACYRWNCCGKPDSGEFDENHSMKEYIVNASTCITEGYTEFRCTKCGYTMSGNTLDIDENNHENASAYYGTKEIHTYYPCCGKATNEVHDLEFVTIISNPTCTDNGVSHYACDCGYWEYVEDQPALGHNPGKGDGYRAPTCEVDGETGRGYCTVCGADLEDSQTIPALGHLFLGEAVSKNDNTHYFKCTRQGCDAYGVGSTRDNTMACTGGTATCTTQATCDICGAKYGNTLGHSFTGDFDAYDDNYHWHICDRNNCNATSTPELHNTTTTTIPVSNTAPGYKQDTCGCGYTKKYDYTYRLIIDLDGGEWTPSGRPATQLIFDGKPGDTIELPNPSKLNHKFDGWSLTGGGSIIGTTYVFGNSHGNATALWLNMFYLDLNGSLNGDNFSSLKHSDGFAFGTADIYVNGEKVADDVTDYYTMHVYGSSYKIVVTAKPGYNFDGKDTVTLTGTIGAADVSVYPKATSNTYKITIDLNPSATTNAVYKGSNPITGTWDERTSVTSNVTIPNPTMPGYKFTGWTITANGTELDSGVMGTEFKNLTSVLNGNVTFTATWEAIKVQYKVHHYLMNTDGTTYALKESEIFSKYADAQHTIADDANVYSGFTYSHGKVFQTGGTEGGIVTKVVIDADGTLNINLYYTRNQYTLTIDPNNGVWNDSTNEQTFTQYHGTDKAIPDPTRTGYTFTGWTLTGAGSYADGTYTFGIGDAKLVAQWTPNVYNIVYDLNDISGTQTPQLGTYRPATGTYDTAFTVSHPTMTGYTFIGWEITGMDGVKHFYGSNETTANSISSTMETEFKNLTSVSGATVTFKALWKANTYNIVYDLNDVSPSQNPVFGAVHPNNATFDKTFTVSNPTMTGYTFIGWTITGMDGVTHFIGANSTDGETIAGIMDTTFMNLTSINGGTVTFTAMWKANTYTVTLNPGNGRVNPATITVTYDQPYGTMPTPVRIGYDFTGWYNAETNGTKITDATSVTTPENHTLYAGWQRSTYTITYVLNGGYYDGNSTITQQYLSGTSITLITPQAPAGKTFVGWFTSYNNSTGMYSGGIGMGGDSYMLTESITVYACYVDKHDLGITVNDIYGEIKIGSQFTTSATIVNNNLMSIIPTDNLKVVMKVYVNGVVNPSMTQVFTNQIVPGKGTQLVSATINTSTWSNSNTYQIEWSIDTSDMDLYTEEVSTNNVSKTISFKPGQYRTITNTERPGYSTTRPGSYQNLTAPSTSTTRYEWTYWTWSNGGFVKRNSADQLDITLLLKPENESGLRDYTTPAFQYLHDYTTRSGYGLSIHTYFCTGCGKALGNATTCGSCRTSGVTSNVQANTTIGKLEAVMTFPEFNYSTANNNCAVLTADKVGNMYTLTLPMYADYNSSDVNDKFAHYTPMWLPDGQYTPVTYISGLWTPLGELTATVQQGQYSNSTTDMNRLHIWSNAIILDGSLYDDLYGN